MTSERVCVCVCGLCVVIGASERLKIPVAFQSKFCVNSLTRVIRLQFHNRARYYFLNTSVLVIVADDVAAH